MLIWNFQIRVGSHCGTWFLHFSPASFLSSVLYGKGGVWRPEHLVDLAKSSLLLMTLSTVATQFWPWLLLTYVHPFSCHWWILIKGDEVFSHHRPCWSHQIFLALFLFLNSFMQLKNPETQPNKHQTITHLKATSNSLSISINFSQNIRFCNIDSFPSMGRKTFSVVQLLSHVWFFATPWTEARLALLSSTIFGNLLTLMSIESVMSSNHLILCCPLLPPSVFSSIRAFSNESDLCIRWPKY